MTQIEMDMIIQVLGFIIAGVFIYVIKPFIDVLIKKIQHTEVIDFTIKAIRAAEQQYTVEQWVEKKDAVIEKVAIFVSEHTKIKMSKAEIETVVEGSIREAKKIYKNDKKED